jgi:thioredoxin reductase (NADPH)
MKVLIVGGGPAAVSTAIWVKKFGVPFDWVGAEFGGTLNRVHNTIDDFPPTRWKDGPTLSESFHRFAQDAGLTMEILHIDELWQTPEGWRVESPLSSVEYGTVVLGTGAMPNRWKVEGHHAVADLIRLSSAKDSAEFRGRRVAVIGGGDGAMEAALRLSKHCEHVDVFVRSKLIARRSYLEAVAKSDRIEIHLETAISLAERHEKGCRLSTDHGRAWDVSAIYLKLGIRANLPKINPTLAMDESGYVKVDAEKQTSRSGLYAVGDVISCDIRSVSNALADGVACARALANVYESIRLRTR